MGVLLIGRHSTSGKSTVARELSHRFAIPVSQVDDYRLALQRATQPGQIEGLHFFLQTDAIWRMTPEELVSRLIRIGQIMSHALESVIAHHVATNTPIILEGDGILPTLAAQSVCDGLNVQGRVRSVFIIEPSEARLYQTCRMRWPSDSVAPDASRWLRLAWAYGQWLHHEARSLNLSIMRPQPWDTLAERVVELL